MWSDGHEDCALCDRCARHLADTDQWPCLNCGRILCDICDCTECETTPC